MRIRSLDLTRYGKFTDRRLDFGEAPSGEPDFHIVYGLNEAGKSTAFSAYLDLLFGIPERSGYNFLHAHGAMQIGAALEIGGQEYDLIRLKRRTSTLIDARGNPVNEGLIAAALGGLGRESYRTMFSLDDQSLKEGGAAIVDSKGDLGELLFSASAGLADVGRTLSTMAAEADAMHKKRARNTQLAQMKQELVALKEKRAAIDIQASAFAQLSATSALAEKTYAEADAELTAARVRHGQIERLLRALPLSRQLERLKEALGAQQALPRPAAGIAALLPRLIRDETRLDTARRSCTERLERVQAEIAALEPDDRVLALTPRMAALSDLRARFRTATVDLPRRRAALDERDAALALQMKALGEPGHADPSALILPATLTGALRDLIERKSGIDAELRTAEREMQRITAALREQDGLPREDEEDTASAPATWRQLAANLEQLRRSDRPVRLDEEKRQLARLGKMLDERLAGLAPYRAGVETLRATTLPDRKALDACREEAAAINRRIAAHRERIRTLENERQLAQTRLSLLQRDGDPIDDLSARASREERDSLWQAHRQALDTATADRFEQAMRRDDQISERRLQRANDLAELSQLTQAMALNRAAAERENALLAEATDELVTLHATLSARLPEALATPDEPLDALLSQVLAWSERRQECLAVADQLAETQDRVAALEAGIEADLDALRTGLKRAGLSKAAMLPPDALFAEAERHVAGLERKAAEKQAREASIARLRAEVAERKRDMEMAEQAAAAWDKAWIAALSRTWFGAGATPVDVRALLDALTGLPALLSEREQLAQRISMMELDQSQFAEEVTSLHTALGETVGPHSVDRADEALMRRHAEALRLADNLAAKRADIEQLEREQQDITAEITAHEADRRRVLEALEADNLDLASQRLEAITARDQLEQRIREIAEQVTTELSARTLDEALVTLADLDEDLLASEAAGLTDRMKDLTTRTRELYAEMTMARSKLDAVGGDGAVAALEAARATVLLDIEEMAMRYLKLRTGARAAGSALDLYREKHRSTMMRRASEAFCQITRGEYSGLTAKPEKDRETLIGIPREGGSRLTEAMSTGTKYQLYLALRLAGYEEFAGIRPPVPFVADDIMETFDEPRSEEVFRLFGAMARIGQVIYLTHHRHLCDIARQVAPSVRIHEL